MGLVKYIANFVGYTRRTFIVGIDEETPEAINGLTNFLGIKFSFSIILQL